MARQPRLQRLTIFLLKQGTSWAEAIRERDDMEEFVVPVLDDSRASLFIAEREPRPPWWAEYLDTHVDEELPEHLFNSSTSAALLLEAAHRLFAVTFGHGRHLIELQHVEQDFGLKVVLNTVAPDQLKSLDARTIDELTMHTRRDVSRDASLSAFGLDVSRDLLRAVTGTPRDERFGRRLTGSDALALNTRAQVPELPDLCAELLDAYKSKEYQKHFDFVDFLRPVRDKEKIAELEQSLVHALRTRQISDLHLAAPEVVDWLGVAGFRFSTQSADAELDADPRITSYLDSLERTVDLETLKRDRLLPIRASDNEPLPGWPVLRCLVYEVQIGDDLYVLSAGEWYRVKLSYKQRVEDDVNAIPDLAIDLPPAETEDQEHEYNQKAAVSAGLLCMDRQFVFEGGPDKMEVCDLLTPRGGFIHVKPRGSSSTLSHLFAQGINSAERLLQDPDFRERTRKLVKRLNPSFTDAVPQSNGRPRPDDHEVSFVVITRSDRPTRLTLPFFSLVSLRAAARRLQTLGFPVSVAAVKQAR